MNNPRCPYCGEVMKYDFNNDLETHWLYCPKCGSRSSVVSYDDDPYAAAMKRDDVKPVKRGNWVDKERHEHYPSGKPYTARYCGVCGKRDHNEDGDFCGYCGADMRKEEDDER